MAVERIVQHKHCTNCGRANPADMHYCSTKCEEDFIALQKRKKMVLYANYAMIVFLLIVLIVAW